ncbi:MAG: MucR family transcriptional regulator [Holosporales bacterium]|jgi:predicted transcriptional regulator|nr:MucR family transcriptional regulator [Holosporales bacterium]
MADNVNLTRKELIELSVSLAAAYLNSNSMSLLDASATVGSFFSVLNELNKTPSGVKGRMPVAPAVPIEDSIHDDYIVCLEDGKKLQMLKRHLSTVYKMTLEEYKERWNLGPDYPVVSPSYARRRSNIAKNTGLGRTGRSGRRKMTIVDSDAGSAVVA